MMLMFWGTLPLFTKHLHAIDFSADSDISLKEHPVLVEATLTAASSQESLYFEDSNSSLDYDTDKVTWLLALSIIIFHPEVTQW